MAEQPTVLHSVESIRDKRDHALSAKYGGFYWGSDFIGFAVAMFFTLVFLGLVAAVVGTVGYQMGPPINATALTTTGIVSLVVSLVVMLIAAIIGGILGANYHRHIDHDIAVAD